MSLKKKYKFDNTNTLILLTDENKIKKYNDIDKLIEYSKSVNTFISYTDGLFTFENCALYDVIKNFDPTKNIYMKFNHVENISGNSSIGLSVTYEEDKFMPVAFFYINVYETLPP